MIPSGSSKWWSVSSTPPRTPPMTRSCSGSCCAKGWANTPPPDRSTPALRQKTSPNRVLNYACLAVSAEVTLPSQEVSHHAGNHVVGGHHPLPRRGCRTHPDLHPRGLH